MSKQQTKHEVLDLGTFEVTSGELMVSDPCYEEGTWCQHVLDGVRNGSWSAVAVLRDGDVAQLNAYIGDLPVQGKFELVEAATIGVDSGQAGIFDRSGYRNLSRFDGVDLQPAKEWAGQWRDPDTEQEVWYAHCAVITLSESRAGVVPGGVVSSSGYGDGAYNLFVRKDKDGEVTGVCVLFLDLYDEDEEEE